MFRVNCRPYVSYFRVNAFGRQAFGRLSAKLQRYRRQHDNVASGSIRSHSATSALSALNTKMSSPCPPSLTVVSRAGVHHTWRWAEMTRLQRLLVGWREALRLSAYAPCAQNQTNNSDSSNDNYPSANWTLDSNPVSEWHVTVQDAQLAIVFSSVITTTAPSTCVSIAAGASIAPVGR